MRANRRALRTIRDERDLAVRYVNALIPSLSETEARQLCERYVAPYFTADGRHDPSVAAKVLSSVAEKLGVSTLLMAPNDTASRRPAGAGRDWLLRA